MEMGSLLFLLFINIIYEKRESVDSNYLGELGIPIMRILIKDTKTDSFYFTYHHSAGDSMYIISADDLDDNVIAIASMLYLVADNEVSLPNDI
jgi:carboxypeptidase Q